MVQEPPNRDVLLGKLREVVSLRKEGNETALQARDRIVLEGEDEPEIDAELASSEDRDLPNQLASDLGVMRPVDF